MRCAPAILAIVSLLGVSCSGSDSSNDPAAAGSSGSGGSASVAKKSPGEACQQAQECACILCTCDTGGAITEACNESTLVCASGQDTCDYACTYVVLGGQKGKWTGEAAVVDCPAYGGLSSPVGLAGAAVRIWR